MKEITAVIRANKVNKTKTALAEAGFPAFTCRACLGRGKKNVDTELVAALLAAGELPQNVIGEHLTEATRLIPKRIFTLIVADELVDKAVSTLIEVNQTGNQGDGKIFISAVAAAYRVRDGQPTDEVY